MPTRIHIYYIYTYEHTHARIAELLIRQVIKGKVGIEEIMAQRRARLMRNFAAVALFLASVGILLFFLLSPRVCNARCRGEWKSETSMAVARADLAAAVYKNRVFVLGGRGLDSVESRGGGGEGWRLEKSMSGNMHRDARLDTHAHARMFAHV